MNNENSVSMSNHYTIKVTNTKVKKAIKITMFGILLIFSLIMLYPFIYMMLAALYTQKEYNSPKTIIGAFPWPKDITWKNYTLLFTFPVTDKGFGLAILNTAIRTGLAIFVVVVKLLFSGYAFSRLKWKGRRQTMNFFIVLTFLPGVLGSIPTYIIFSRLDIIDTWWVYLIGIPGFDVMGTYLIKNYMDTMPISVDESAKLDGAGHMTIMFRILLPMCLPIFAYVAIGAGIGTWNDWGTTQFWARGNPKLVTIAYLISNKIIGDNNAPGNVLPDYPKLIGYGFVLTIPSLLIFAFFQKYIIQGVANSGLKD